MKYVCKTCDVFFVFWLGLVHDLSSVINPWKQAIFKCNFYFILYVVNETFCVNLG